MLISGLWERTHIVGFAVFNVIIISTLKDVPRIVINATITHFDDFHCSGSVITGVYMKIWVLVRGKEGKRRIPSSASHFHNDS